MEWLALHPALLAFFVGQVVSQIAVFDTTIYLHRAQTHKSLDLHPMIDWLCRFSLWLTTGLSTKEWVAIHRKHHAFTDEEGDPHSPRLMGFWSVQLGNVFHYIKESKNKEVIERYSRDIKDDWFGKHGLLGLGLGIAILCSVLGIGWGLFAGGVHALTYVFGLSSSINGLCHAFGYKNFNNTATNIRFLGLIAGGEGLHNNHHGYPRSPKFSTNRLSEFDPAWPIIKFLIFCRLAKRAQTIEEILAV